MKIGLRPAIVIAALTVLFAWSYWTTLERLVATWIREPDYSHGFFAADPVALCFLWARSATAFRNGLGDSFPSSQRCLPQRVLHSTPQGGFSDWAGLLPVAVSIAMRLAGANYYLERWTVGSIIVLGGGGGLAVLRAARCFGGAFPPCSSCGLWSACPSVSNSNSAIRCGRSPPT